MDLGEAILTACAGQIITVFDENVAPHHGQASPRPGMLMLTEPMAVLTVAADITDLNPEEMDAEDQPPGCAGTLGVWPDYSAGNLIIHHPYHLETGETRWLERAWRKLRAMEERLAGVEMYDGCLIGAVTETFLRFGAGVLRWQYLGPDACLHMTAGPTSKLTALIMLCRMMVESAEGDDA